MSKKYLKYSVVSFLLCISGCDIAPTGVFFNNSDFDLTIFMDNEDFQILKKTSKELLYPGVYKSIRIKSNKKIFFYDFIYPHTDFAKYYLKKNKIYCQFESDGLIYILKKNEDFPLINLTDQLRGFPIRPTFVEQKGVEFTFDL